MTVRRGLTTKLIGLRVIRLLTVLAGLVVCGVYLVTIVSGPPVHPALIQSLTLLLIALTAYSWVVLPISVAAVFSLVGGLMLLGGWAITGLVLLGLDLIAFVILIGIASWQQRRRTRRLLRLTQQLNDLEEELYLKEQASRIAQQTREALGHKHHRYQQLQTIAERLSRLVKLEEVCQLAVDQAFELIGKSDACMLFLVDKDRQELALQASRKLPSAPAIRTKHGDQFDRYVLRTQRPLLVNDVRRDFRFSVTGSADRTIGSVVACPLLVDQSVEGVLRLDSSQPSVYTQDDLRFLDILLDLVDTAITNARLFAQSQELALIDGLTGLYRRQPFVDQLTRELARAQRTRDPVTLLMLDVDNFKQYNDTFGHTAGDVVLKTIADIVRSTIPPDGMCARYGGEEFAIVLPKLAREQGGTVANRIRQAVEETGRALGLGFGAGQPVTVSLGVAVFPDDAQSDTELLRRSDQRLYHAKRSGKNCVWAS